MPTRAISLIKLARYLGEHFGEKYQHGEEISEFTIRVIKELQNQITALQIQIEQPKACPYDESIECSLIELDHDIKQIKIGLAVIKKLLCGQVATVKVGKRTIQITPDEALKEFSRME